MPGRGWEPPAGEPLPERYCGPRKRATLASEESEEAMRSNNHASISRHCCRDCRRFGRDRPRRGGDQEAAAAIVVARSASGTVIQPTTTIIHDGSGHTTVIVIPPRAPISTPAPRCRWATAASRTTSCRRAAIRAGRIGSSARPARARQLSAAERVRRHRDQSEYAVLNERHCRGGARSGAPLDQDGIQSNPIPV